MKKNVWEMDEKIGWQKDERMCDKGMKKNGWQKEEEIGWQKDKENEWQKNEGNGWQKDEGNGCQKDEENGYIKHISFLYSGAVNLSVCLCVSWVHTLYRTK